MAYALKFLGASSQYLELATPLDFLSDTNWTVEFRANVPNGSQFAILGDLYSSTGIIFAADFAIRIRADGSGTQESIYHYDLAGIGWTTYKIEKITDTVKIYLDDVEVVSKTSANISGWVQEHTFKYINKTGTTYSDVELEWMKVNGTTIAHNWDATSSTHSGAVQLDDIAGSNHATGYNFPNDGTEWVDLDPTPESLTLTTADYTFRKKNGSSATHTVEGTYLDNPTAIEYSVDGGAWQTGVASPTGGTFSFNVEIPIGESNVDVRFANDTAITASVILVTPDLTVTMGVMQSNGSGRGINNQTYAQANGVKAYLFGNDDQFKLLEDPYDSGAGQIDSVSDDGVAGGSWIVRFAHYWIQNKGTPIAIIPCAKGGTSILSWEPTDPLYTSMERRINAVGGVDVVFSQIGETDSSGSTTGAQYESTFNTIANDINTKFGAETFIIPLHTITASGYDGNGTTTGQDAIRQAQIDVASSNSNVRIGQPLTDIDISDQDGLHFRADDELDLVASRMYDSYTGVISTLSISITGSIPDGSYTVTLTDPNDSMSNIYSGSTTITGGSIVIPDLSYPASTTITGYLLGNGDPQTKGIVIRGVTA